MAIRLTYCGLTWEMDTVDEAVAMHRLLTSDNPTVVSLHGKCGYTRVGRRWVRESSAVAVVTGRGGDS